MRQTHRQTDGKGRQRTSEQVGVSGSEWERNAACSALKSAEYVAES